MSLADAVGACLPGFDADLITEVADILSEEIVGSTVDVLDAVGHLLGEDEAEQRSRAEALHQALARMSRKRPRIPLTSGSGSSSGSGLAAFTWKREYMSGKARFELPYLHTLGSLADTAQSPPTTLVLKQAEFGPEGFASTVWDSSIVLARFMERHAPRYAQRRAIELGAGCGLPSLVLHALGADVTLTDLAGNLPLLEDNARSNALGRAPARVVELCWGPPPLPASLGAPYDLILATDVLYSHDAVTPLVETLAALAGARSPPAEVLMAAGRNRHAGVAFFSEVAAHFDVSRVPDSELDPTYQCEDVEVWRLALRERVLDLGGVRYVAHPGRGSALRQLLADGAAGPVVGRLGDEGDVTLDEAAWGGEWVGELLTATVVPRRLGGASEPNGEGGSGEGPLPPVPDAIRAAIARGAAAEWRGCLEPGLVAACRAEVAAMDGEGLLSRSNHAQQATTRGDRVGYLDLHHPSAGEDRAAEADVDSEHEPCPPHLRQLFSRLEALGGELQSSLGRGALLTPRLGMVAVYDGANGYVRHLDNERHRATGPASGYRNFRVLTAIAYLNDPEWGEGDGGQLRCYAPLEATPAGGGGALGGEADGGQPPGDRPPGDRPPGGQPPGGGPAELEIVPRGGTVVVFPSQTVPHEVLPARRPRLAATLWMVSSSLLQADAEEDSADTRAGGGGDSSVAMGGDGASSFTATWSCRGGGGAALFAATDAGSDAGPGAATTAASGAPGSSCSSAGQFSFGF